MKGSPLRLFTIFTSLIAIYAYFFLDRPIAEWSAHYCTGKYNNFFVAVTQLGISTPYLIGSALLFFYFYYVKKIFYLSYHALFVFTAVALSGIVSDIIKIIVGRFRPCMLFEKGLYGFDFFHRNSAMNSFPSGHTTTAFALAMYVSIFWPRWAAIGWIIAFSVGVSRILLTMHYLSDVLAGALLGTITVSLLTVYFYKLDFILGSKKSQINLK
ncbi:MAG: phosphatase PAP2 family protein [Sulfuricurvum sp.]|uniref:phosphatase PAP2 family protein n=1 Tax=Sulfuricurvum sp. TaxID=2025608 RepID=UPI002623D8BB|nr:phosphatase PAP2 family protein [Sulfuricurvum sp.]MDD2784106.1 phosphatase PAP2 family protein [Sulfuricurvum sp.]